MLALSAFCRCIIVSGVLFTKCLFTLKDLVFLSKWVVKLVHFSSNNKFYPLKDKKSHLLKNNFYYFCISFKQGALRNADIIFYLYNLYLHRNENFRVRRFSLFFFNVTMVCGYG